MTWLALVRHGATEWNETGLVQGHSDVPLSDRGRAEVARWRLPPALAGFALVSSPLARAVETARLIAGEPEIAARVTAVTWVGRRRWNLDIDGRIKVKLPEGDTAAAWQRLARMQRRDRILDRALSVLDLRHGDRVVLRPAADTVPPGKESDA